MNGADLHVREMPRSGTTPRSCSQAENAGSIPVTRSDSSAKGPIPRFSVPPQRVGSSIYAVGEVAPPTGGRLLPQLFWV